MFGCNQPDLVTHVWRVPASLLARLVSVADKIMLFAACRYDQHL